MLAHDRRQPPLPAAIEVAEPAVAVSIVGMSGTVILPDQREGDPLAPEFAMNRLPIRLCQPRRVLLPGVNSRCSSAASSSVSGSGHDSPARSARLRYSLTVGWPTFRFAAIFRVDNPAALRRRTSEILRIGNRLILGFLLILEDGKVTRCTIAQQIVSRPEAKVVGHPGTRDRIRPESLTGCYRNC